MRKIVGIDIGGTKISCLLATKNGQPLDEKTIPTFKGKMAHKSIRELLKTVEFLLKQNKVPLKDIQGIGVALPGPVNPQKGTVPWSPNMPGWKGRPLSKILRNKFRVPVFMDNDANAAAMGEKLFGAGRKVGNLIYVTVSTGVGGGIVLNGKVHRGASFCGGEIGHMTVVPGGNRCQCGKSGCLEAYSSGTAIALAAKKRLRNLRSFSDFRNAFRSPDLITGEVVFEAAKFGDVTARKVFAEAGKFLGVGLANLVNVLNPEMIVLGGSVMKARAYFWKAMMGALRENSWPMALSACEIRLTALGSYVGNLGAAALVLEPAGG